VSRGGLLSWLKTRFGDLHTPQVTATQPVAKTARLLYIDGICSGVSTLPVKSRSPPRPVLGMRSNTPAQLFQLCQDYGASTRTESTAVATITPAGRINAPPAINSRISRLPFLNSWLFDPARSTLDGSKIVSTDPGTFGGILQTRRNSRNGRVLGHAGEDTLAAEILRGYIAPEATRDTHRSHFLAMRG
jgi:hypothetical protein